MISLTVFVVCMLGTGLSYFLGLRTPARFGTAKGWTASMVTGLILGLMYFVYSAYGMLFSLDSLTAFDF
jgi:thiamine transporter ThiT